MKKILITGSEGFIGSAVADTVLSNCVKDEGEYEITLVDKKDNGCALKLIKDITKQNTLTKLKFLKQNLADEAKIEELNSFDVIVHLAALIDATESHSKEKLYFEYNHEVTRSLLQKIKNGGKFIFASSAAVYGIPRSLPSNELDELIPNSPYGVSKLEAEKEVVHYCSNRNMNYNILRFFNVSGCYEGNILSSQPNFSQNLFAQIVGKFKKGEPFVVNGSNFDTLDGTCERDFLDINWLARFINSLVTSEDKFGSFISNVGNGTPTSIKQLVEELARSNPKFEYIISEPRAVEIPRSYACVRSLTEILEKLEMAMPPSKISDIAKGVKL